jgi:hypothetical protein
MPVEQFLSKLRFENRGKFYDLRLEIDFQPEKQVDNGSSPLPIKHCLYMTHPDYRDELFFLPIVY